MDRNRKNNKKAQAKKKQGGKPQTGPSAHELLLMDEEERLVQLTMELSLREANEALVAAEAAKPAIEENKSTFEPILFAALLRFDPDLESLLHAPLDDSSESNTFSTSLAHQYMTTHLHGAKEKAFKERLNLALFIACLLGHARIAKYLLERGANPAAKIIQGWTTLHWAAVRGHIAVFQMVLTAIQTYNLLPDYKDKAEMTPYDLLAQELEQVPVKVPIELLKLYGRWKATGNAFDRRAALKELQDLEHIDIVDDNDNEANRQANAFLNGGYDDDESPDALTDDVLDVEDAEDQDEAPIVPEPPSQLVSWGSAASQLLGQGGSKCPQPKRVRPLDQEDIVTISTSQFMSAIVTASGKAYIWGFSEGARLGFATSFAHELSPCLIPQSSFGGFPVVSVSVSNYHGAFVTADGMLFTFGRGREGQLGLGNNACDPTSLSDPNAPSTLSYLSRGSSVLNNSGKRSDSPFGAAVPAQSSAETHYPDLIPTGGEGMPHYLKRIQLSLAKGLLAASNPRDAIFVTQVACSDSHTAILTKSGHCWTFGNGSRGQLGHDVLKGESVPKLVRGLGERRFRHLSVGPTHTVLATSKEVYVFGFGNPTPHQQKFAFKSPSAAIKSGLLASFHICALASGAQHFLILTKEGDVFSCIHGDKFPVPVNIDVKAVEKQRQHFENAMADDGFKYAPTSSKRTTTLTGQSYQDQRSGMDRERHHVVAIAAVGNQNYLTTSDGIVLTFSNIQRNAATNFTRLDIQPRIRMLAPSRNHYLATVDRPLPPRESTRPQVPPRLLLQHLEQVYSNDHYTDVAFECDKETRKAHRFVLAISPVLNAKFEEELQKSTQDNHTVIIRLDDKTSLVALDMVLAYIYSGLIVQPLAYPNPDMKRIAGLSHADLEAVIALASSWQLQELVELLLGPKLEALSHVKFTAHVEADESSEEQSEEREVPVPHKAWVRKMTQHLAGQIANGKFSDAKLVVGVNEAVVSKSSKITQQGNECSIPIHRALLVERSEWFRLTLSLSSGWSESHSAQVVMPHLGEASTMLALSYLYTDSLSETSATLESIQELTDLLATVDEILMPELKAIVARRLSRLLHPDNVVAILDVAETYQSEELCHCIMHYMAQNVELLLRIGAIADLTIHQLTFLEQVVLEQRGVHPWRYFKQETEDRLLKYVNSSALGTLHSSPKPGDSDAHIEESKDGHADPSLPDSAEVSAAPLPAEENVYIPPAKRRAMEAAAAAESAAKMPVVSSSPSSGPSFMDIQREQMAAEAAKAVPKLSPAKSPSEAKPTFTWATPTSKSPAPGTPPPQNKNSDAAWPDLPSSKPSRATSNETMSSAPADASHDELWPSSAPTPSNSSSLPPVAAAKKGKALPSPLRDPKSLSAEKDAIFTPKAAPVTETPTAATNNQTQANAKPAPGHPKTQPTTQNKNARKPAPANTSPQASSSTDTSQTKASLKMALAATEYRPSMSTTATEPGQTQTKPQQPQYTNAGGNRNQNQSRQGQKQKKPKNGGDNDLRSAMKPNARRPEPVAAIAEDEQLAIALSRSMDTVSLVEIQKQEAEEHSHRSKTLAEIQDEERQLEEHRMVEAYYAARKEEHQQQAHDNNARPGARKQGNKAGKPGNRGRQGSAGSNGH